MILPIFFGKFFLIDHTFIGIYYFLLWFYQLFWIFSREFVFMFANSVQQYVIPYLVFTRVSLSESISKNKIGKVY